MDLVYDNDSSAEIYIKDTLNEDTGKQERTYKIAGIFSTIGQRNRNGRTYPRNLWEAQVTDYQKNLEDGSINCLMEYEHPARSTVDPIKAVAKINKLYIEGDYVMGEATLLNNAVANQLKSLIDNGIRISVSSRGVGSVKNGIVENFKLVTYDVVPYPSDYNATMNGIVEGYQLTEGVIPDFIKDTDTDAVPVEEQQKTIKDQFVQLLTTFKCK